MTETEQTFSHSRYDDIRNGKGEFVFAKGEYYTPEEVNQMHFCAFRKEENGETQFRCADALRYDGDRLCQTHFKAWIAHKKEQEAIRDEKRADWFERECQKEYDNMLDNGTATFSPEVTTTEQKEAIMWKMAQALVRGRDRYANKSE